MDDIIGAIVFVGLCFGIFVFGGYKGVTVDIKSVDIEKAHVLCLNNDGLKSINALDEVVCKNGAEFTLKVKE